MFEDICIPKS